MNKIQPPETKRDYDGFYCWQDLCVYQYTEENEVGSITKGDQNDSRYQERQCKA